MPPLLAAFSDNIGVIIAVVAAVIALPFVGLPLFILAKQRFEAKPKIVPFDVDDYDWPRDIDRLFKKTIPALEEEGFEVIDGMFLPSIVPNVKTALVLMANRAERDAAIVTAIFGMPVQPGSPKSLHVEFGTEFDDDHDVDTNNSKELSSFPTPPNTTKHFLPQVKSPHTLYRIHRALCDRHADRPRKRWSLDEKFDGDGARLLQYAVKKEFDLAVTDGYLSCDGTYYKPTVKGAFLMVWKELPPWKPIRKMQRDKQANALLAELEREGVDLSTK